MTDTKPVLVEWSEATVKGRPGHRLMVVLRAPGCEYARKGTGCTNCSFPWKMATGRPVSTEDLLAQLESALGMIPDSSDDPVEVDLYNSGSFFNPNEIPADAQERILARIGALEQIDHVLVESRPEYVGVDRVAKAARMLGNKTLEIGIGLESADEVIREQRIGKGFTLRDFERAAKAIAEAGASLLSYVLLKPMGTTEREAIEDSVQTIESLFRLGDKLDLPVRAALQPCFVGPGTPLDEAYRAGEYRPPWLWSVVDVVRRTAAKGPVIVGLSDEDLSPAEIPHNCELCTDRFRDALRTYNANLDISPLDGLTCECAEAWRASL